MDCLGLGSMDIAITPFFSMIVMTVSQNGGIVCSPAFQPMLLPAGAEDPAEVDDTGGAVAGDGVDDAGASFRAIPPSMGI